jgi:lipopolysaccharide/colanic/teichoic acid biosynthesis glycosyltransferase
VRIYPVLMDARPPFLGQGPSSLLLTPTGRGTVLQLLGGEVTRHTHTPLLILTGFEPNEEYGELIRAQGFEIEDIVSVAGFLRRVHSYAPSDCLLIRDSRRVTVDPLDLGDALRESPQASMLVRHLVTPAGTTGGTSERVLLDTEGRVSRIQRYYESVTWPFASGVVCSIVPVASTSMLTNLPFDSLPELRATLTASALPSQDVMVSATVFDLSQESGLLGLVEQMTVRRAREEQPPFVSPKARVDETAVLQGPVVVEGEAEIGPRALIIGPAVIGAGSRIGADCVVAHALVTAGAEVPAGSLLRQCIATPERGWGQPVGPVVEQAVGTVQAGSIEEVPDTNAYLSAVELKAPFEIALCALALLALSPLLALLALFIKIESRGPILYGDRREGKDGRQFSCWKFRTMIQGADARQRLLARQNQMDGPQFKMASDPRVTRVGRILRPLSLDEIPQLLNVALGEMSLVGPRPSPFRENQMCIPWREARLSVRPGITGLWQVCRHDRDEGDFHQWIYYDLLYVRHMSPWLDLKILTATVITLGGRYSVPLSWLLPPSKFYDRRRASRDPRADMHSLVDHA